MFRLFQSYYKPEQRQFISNVCYPYDNTANLNPDIREYPQMKDVHKQCYGKVDIHGQPIEAYGLISWKFQDKALVSPEDFLSFVESNPHLDAWFINPCYIIDALFLNPWEQGEIHHPGITQLAYDTIIGMYNKGLLDTKNVIDFDAILPSSHTFYANYFMATPRVWTELFDFTENFYKTISEDESLTKRMMAASGYVSDPGMSHFIFLFERLVPSFFWQKKYKVGKYQYKYSEVERKSPKGEFEHTQVLSIMKDWLCDDPLNQKLLNSYLYCREAFLDRYPNAFYKE